MTTATAPVIRLAAPHAAQERVRREARRFNVVVCGRRFGKTEMGIALACETALDGYPAAWFAPTYKDSGAVWRELKRTLRDVITAKNEQEMRLELITGGSIDVWTLNDPDSGRGRKYARAVVDEAAKVRYLEQAWTETIRPTLSDYRGDAWFLSTPKGRNYFWRLYNMTHSYDSWASWQMPTSENPYIAADEIESARLELPQSAFAQEYLAEFTDDAGAVFRNIRGCVDASLPLQEPVHNRRYFGGLDWAQQNDFTVITVVDDTGAVVAIDRFNQVNWATQYGRVQVMTERWQLAHGLAELNSIGSPNLEQLQAQGLRQWAGFTTTNETKAVAIQALTLAFERGEIRIPNDATLIAELESFEANRLPSGKWRYEAPEGMHDDMVISLALAWEAYTNPPSINIQRVAQSGLYRSTSNTAQRKAQPR